MEDKVETILTLNIDQKVVDFVENYAQHTHKSMSQLVEECLFSHFLFFKIY